MSHFTVMVIGDDVEKQLAPFHEFECTGRDDEFVQEIDETEQARKEYLKDRTMQYKDPKGKLHDPFQDRFYREFTEEEIQKHGFGSRHMLGSGFGDGISWTSKDWGDGQGYRAKVNFVPEGWKEVRVKTSTLQSFLEFVKSENSVKAVRFGSSPDLRNKHKYGYVLLDENGDVAKLIRRTNPNKKYDWYQIGGRWNGFFKLLPNRVAVIGSPGIQDMNPDYKPPAKDRADQCMKGDVDIEGMRCEAAEKAAAEYDMFAKVTAGLPRHQSWTSFRKKHGKDVQKARDEYHAQPVLKALCEIKEDEARWLEADDFLFSREKYIQDARDNAIRTFALVKNSQWYEKGEMGFWGAVHNEKRGNTWLREFNAAFDALPDDAMLTVVDCHI